MNYTSHVIKDCTSILVCPSKVKLNCANVMYSKTCNGNYDCSYAGPQFVCCETGCTGDSQFVCVPEGRENLSSPYWLIFLPSFVACVQKQCIQFDYHRFSQESNPKSKSYGDYHCAPKEA